jgi:RsiW-degrading membrane proteinase PrsW (M82 family)
MFALGFYVTEEDGYEKTEWSIEYPTDDIGEAADNLFDARNQSAAGNRLWDGSHAMLLVLRDGEAVWEPLSEQQYAE